MAAFRSLTADRQPFKPFELAAQNCSTRLINEKSKASRTELPLHLFEWSQISQDEVEVNDIRSVSELEARDVPTVRVL